VLKGVSTSSPRVQREEKLFKKVKKVRKDHVLLHAHQKPDGPYPALQKERGREGRGRKKQKTLKKGSGRSTVLRIQIASGVMWTGKHSGSPQNSGLAQGQEDRRKRTTINKLLQRTPNSIKRWEKGFSVTRPNHRKETGDAVNGGKGVKEKPGKKKHFGSLVLLPQNQRETVPTPRKGGEKIF